MLNMVILNNQINNFRDIKVTKKKKWLVVGFKVDCLTRDLGLWVKKKWKVIYHIEIMKIFSNITRCSYSQNESMSLNAYMIAINIKSK